MPLKKIVDKSMKDEELSDKSIEGAANVFQMTNVQESDLKDQIMSKEQQEEIVRSVMMEDLIKQYKQGENCKVCGNNISNKTKAKKEVEKKKPEKKEKNTTQAK